MIKRYGLFILVLMIGSLFPVFSQQTLTEEAKETLESSLMKKCISFYNEREYDKAMLLLDQVIRNSPSSYKAFYLKFRIKETLGEEDGLYYLKKAVLLYNSEKKAKTIDSPPEMDGKLFEEINSYLNAHTLSYKFYLQGLDFLKKGDWMKAIASLEDAIGAKKRSEYYFKLGDIYVDINEKQSAVRYYSDGLALTPSDVKVRIKLLQLYKDSGDFQSAYQQARILKDLQSDNELILKMYDDLSGRINTRNSGDLTPDPIESGNIMVEKVSGKTIYFKYKGDFHEKIRALVFKKHVVYDKDSKEAKGRVLISSVDKNGLFKALSLENLKNIEIGDYIKSNVD